MTLHDVRTPATKIIQDHTPSLSSLDESELFDIVVAFGEGDADIADLAIRTCQCGTRIDGFYEYADHLQTELRKAGHQ